MRAKTLLATGALALSMVAIGSAKSWNIMVDSPTKAGTLTLPAGNYHVKLTNGNQATFTASDSGKTYNVPVKVQNVGPRKYSETAVETRNENGAIVMHTIDLGGTTEELSFGD